MDDFLLPNATGSRPEVFLSPYDPYSGWLSQYFMGKTSPQEPFSFQVAFLLFAQAGRLEHLQSPTAKLGVLEVSWPSRASGDLSRITSQVFNPGKCLKLCLGKYGLPSGNS